MISGALHLGIFEQPGENHFFSNCYGDVSVTALPFHPRTASVAPAAFYVKIKVDEWDRKK
jgi:hypothetical protein